MSKNFYRPHSGFSFPSEPKNAPSSADEHEDTGGFHPSEDSALGDLLEDAPFDYEDQGIAEHAMNPDPQEELLLDLPEDTPEPDSDTPEDSGPVISAEELALLCREHICPHCPAKHEADELRLRSLADLDNARKRLDREKQESIRFSTEKVLNDIIPALDNLDLALQHAPKDETSKNFVVGVDMTRRLMLDALKNHGFEAVGALGEEFDPARHEAVGMMDAPDVEPNHVSAMLSCGYSLNGRLLRPARVVVCKR